MAKVRRISVKKGYEHGKNRKSDMVLQQKFIDWQVRRLCEVKKK